MMTASKSWAPFLLTLVLSAVVAAEVQQHWNFEDGQENAAPSEFSFTSTGNGRVGQWVIKTEASAPSGTHVLAQVDRDTTDFRFPMAVADQPLLADLRLAVHCKSVSGKVDQVCGLVFRYQDENNYYVTRANALEDNVNLYHVVNGQRRQFAGWRGQVTGNTWHTLQAEARGDHFTISWDGQQIIDAHDQTFSQAGKVGVWTKADSVTYFDDLSVESLQP